MAAAWGVTLAMLAADDVVLCRQELAPVTEPDAWRAWPVLPDLGGYEVTGIRSGCVGHGMLCGLRDAELRDAELCPRSGVALGDFSIYQSARDLRLRESGGVFVVSSFSSNTYTDLHPPPEAESFVAAFRRENAAPHPAFRDSGVQTIALVLVAGLLGLSASAVASRRALKRVDAYRDPRRYRRGMRDGSGTIVFDDGTPPVVTGKVVDRWDPTPNPVLVRIAAVSPGDYRVAPQTTAVDIVAADVVPALAHRANRWLVGAGCAGLLVSVLVIVVVALHAITTAFQSMD